MNPIDTMSIGKHFICRRNGLLSFRQPSLARIGGHKRQSHHEPGVPPSGRFSAETMPPRAVTSLLTCHRPIPLPPAFLVLNGSNRTSGNRSSATKNGKPAIIPKVNERKTSIFKGFRQCFRSIPSETVRGVAVQQPLP
jgi:hypothetical protein